MGGGWSAPRPGRFTPGKDPLYRRLGRPKGRSGRVRKNSPPTGIRSPDRPSLSESLYRLSCPGPSPTIGCYLNVNDSTSVFTSYSTIFVQLTRSFKWRSCSHTQAYWGINFRVVLWDAIYGRWRARKYGQSSWSRWNRRWWFKCSVTCILWKLSTVTLDGRNCFAVENIQVIAEEK